jgi:hypothetical protein
MRIKLIIIKNKKKKMTEELTQKEYQERAFETVLAKSIIANQYALNQNDLLKGTKFYKANIKKSGNELKTALINAEAKEFYKVMKVDATKVVETYKSIDKALNTLAKAVFVDFDEVDMVLKALAKDRDSIIGIAKKIMR